MLKKGLIQVYTGVTKRFNFAPIGISLRAAGQNLRVLITSFVPYEPMEGAATASALLKPNLIIDHTGIEGRSSQDRLSKDKILDSFQRAKDALRKADFDIVILNGINPILSQGIVSLENTITLMEEKPANVELVLTGPGAPKEVIDKADLVTYMVIRTSEDHPVGKHSPQATGPIEVITGDGKGKTTYCLGKAMLASCQGIKSAIFQFIKSPQPYGEVKAITKFPHLGIKTMGEGFLNVNASCVSKKHIEAANQAWKVSVKEILSRKYGLVVLDEINIATHYGLIRWEQIREMLEQKPENLHLLFSGRNAPPEVTAAATTVIEMREIKHPFNKGIKARKGIEF
jgi:cob(I)alamin adenosyltransferase